MAEASESYEQPYYQDDNYVEAPKAPKLFDPSYLLPRLLFRWHWILIGLILGLAYGFVNIRMATPMFKSQAVVRVVEKSSGGADVEKRSIDLRSQQAVDSVKETFLQSKLREAVAEDPSVQNLANLRPPPPKTISAVFSSEEASNSVETEPMSDDEISNALTRWVGVNTVKNSRLIEISVLHPDPAVAQKIANKMVQHHSSLRRQLISKGLSEDAQIVKHELDTGNALIVELNQLLNIYDAAVKAEKKFISAESAKKSLELTFTELHPKMEAAAKLLKTEKGVLIEELVKILASGKDNEYWDRFRAHVDQMRDLMATRISELKSKLSTAETSRDTNQELLNSLKTDVAKTESEVESYEDAQLPKHAYSPNRGNIMTKGTIFGVAIGVALAFLFQLFDNKIGSVAEVEQAYELPVLSAVKKLPDEEVMEAEKAALVNLPPSFDAVHPNLAVPGWASDPVYSEMFRVLRASVSLLGDASERNVTLVSSSIPGEGKTFVAANMALAFAKQGTKTLLIDFDLRKPAVHKIFGQPRHGFQGIVNVLNGTAGLGDVIATFEGFTNLSVIFSGVKSPSPGELLEPSKLYSVIEAYAGNFDHVIIDSAPLLPVPDTRILAPLAHNFCLVVRADHTPRKATYSALELLAADGISPSGVVLNDFTEKRMQAGKYGYGYGYGEYGEKEEEEEDIL